MWTQMPEILRGGWNRALRSAWAGLVISLDYKWTLRGLDDESEEYASYLTQIHQRAAQVSSPTYFSFEIEIGQWGPFNSGLFFQQLWGRD